MPLLERCPLFRGWCVQASMELVPEDVSLLERCPHFRGWYVQASMESGPEDVSLLERCPHFRGWCVQASMELGPEDVSLKRGALISDGGMYRLQWSWDPKIYPCLTYAIGSISECVQCK